MGRKPLAAFPHSVFPFCPVALVAPSLIAGLGALGRKLSPRHPEIGACLFEGRRGAARLLSWIGTSIEAGQPLPRVLVMRLTDTARDCADGHVAEIDVPAVLAFGDIGGG